MTLSKATVESGRTVLDGAVFDPTGAYRYTLTRSWPDGRGRVAFVLLNPSTADSERDDPTIRRCIGFARHWGFGALEVVNLFAYRTPHPAALRMAPDPVGPDNDRHLLAAFGRAELLVTAWGVHGAWRGRGREVARLLLARGKSLGKSLHCLGLTKGGFPRHVLYLERSRRPRPYRPDIA